MTDGFRLSAAGDWIEKDPAAVLNYGLCFDEYLQEGDTIATASWTVAVGLTKVSDAVNVAPMTVRGKERAAGTVALVRLSGGTAGQSYLVTCRITTDLGDVDDRSFTVRVKEK